MARADRTCIWQSMRSVPLFGYNGGAGSLRQVECCSASVEGVSKGHEGPTVQDGRLGTEILPDEQLGGEALRGGTEEVDAEQSRER